MWQKLRETEDSVVLTLSKAKCLKFIQTLQYGLETLITPTTSQCTMTTSGMMLTEITLWLESIGSRPKLFATGEQNLKTTF